MREWDYILYNIYYMNYHILLSTLNFANRRENLLSIKYPDLYLDILNFNKSHDDIKFKQKVFNYMNNIIEIPKCKRCSSKVNFFNNKYSIYCSNVCKNGDDDFIKKSSISRNNSMMYKYGTNYTFNVCSIKEKINTTLKDRYNIDNISKLDITKKKISNTKKNNTISKYEKNSINLVSIDDNRIMSILCDKCNKIYDINYTTYLLRIKNGFDCCTKCNKLNNFKSSHLEKSIFDFIKLNDVKIISNYKIGNKELDIYIPELKLGFEFNGLYWHSELFKDKNYHLDKTKLCLNQNISLFHIWEDDWLYRQDIVKSMILNKLCKTPNKIFARKTEIKIIEDNKLIRTFLDKNHIQGFVGSNVKLGLYYNDELVSLMTFGNLRKSLGQNSQVGSYELLRFCNKINTSVIGGASKLFKYFKDNYNPKEVISYSDYSRSNGNMYKQLGFNLKNKLSPNYYWVVKGKKYHRFNFRKDRLIKDGYDKNMTEIEIMHQRGLYRIFDCGMQKWTYTYVNK